MQDAQVTKSLQVYHVLITNEHSLMYNQNYRFALFFKMQIKSTIQVLRF